MLKLTEKCKLLYDLIMKIPADLDEIRTELENGGYSLDELAAVSYEFADTCFLESIDCFCEDIRAAKRRDNRSFIPTKQCPFCRSYLRYLRVSISAK